MAATGRDMQAAQSVVRTSINQSRYSFIPTWLALKPSRS